MFERVTNKSWKYDYVTDIQRFIYVCMQISKIIILKMLSNHAKVLAMFILYLHWLIFEAKVRLLTESIHLREWEILRAVKWNVEMNTTWGQKWMQVCKIYTIPVGQFWNPTGKVLNVVNTYNFQYHIRLFTIICACRNLDENLWIFFYLFSALLILITARPFLQLMQHFLGLLKAIVRTN